MTTTKLDLTKEYKIYYTAKTTPEVVEFDEAQFLGIKGRGAPGGKEFAAKIEALYPIAYGVKNLCKKQDNDFGIPKLEGLWWVESDKSALEVTREEWLWKLLIRMPKFVTSEIVEKAKAEIIKKKGIGLVEEVRFERITEGKCIQIMHVGPYSTEPESLSKMRKLMEKKNLIENGVHHEIYLSDPRRVSGEKMKTILRQPVKERT